MDHHPVGVAVKNEVMTLPVVVPGWPKGEAERIGKRGGGIKGAVNHLEIRLSIRH